jgi:hypothetical protein
MLRKKSEWRCGKCNQFICKPYEPHHEYTSQKLNKDGVWEKTVHTIEMQREAQQTCYDCDGSGTLTAYDVRTADELEALDYDEQRRVAQQIDKHTPFAVVIAVLQQATGALNHEDEDYVPAIRVAIGVLRDAQTS